MIHLNTHLTLNININSTCMLTINVNFVTTKFIEENIGNLGCFGIGKYLLNRGQSYEP